MPTYDFRCPKCSHHFEAVLPFGSKTRPLCPQCRHAKTEKLIAPPAIHFKGTGFFKTDSQKKHSPEKKTQTEKPEPKPTKPDATASTQKPDTKPSP